MSFFNRSKPTKRPSVPVGDGGTTMRRRNSGRFAETIREPKVRAFWAFKGPLITMANALRSEVLVMRSIIFRGSCFWCVTLALNNGRMEWNIMNNVHDCHQPFVAECFRKHLKPKPKSLCFSFFMFLSGPASEKLQVRVLVVTLLHWRLSSQRDYEAFINWKFSERNDLHCVLWVQTIGWRGGERAVIVMMRNVYDDGWTLAKDAVSGNRFRSMALDETPLQSETAVAGKRSL